VKKVTEDILAKARSAGWFGVAHLKARFKYVTETERTAIMLRQRTGKKAVVGRSLLEAAVRAVRTNPRLYEQGPGALRDIGITHVGSVIFALLRLLPLNKLIR
jgi:hypothetical protein